MKAHDLAACSPRRANPTWSEQRESVVQCLLRWTAATRRDSERRGHDAWDVGIFG